MWPMRSRDSVSLRTGALDLQFFGNLKNPRGAVGKDACYIPISLGIHRAVECRITVLEGNADRLAGVDRVLRERRGAVDEASNPPANPIVHWQYRIHVNGIDYILNTWSVAGDGSRGRLIHGSIGISSERNDFLADADADCIKG